jgi:hypothetical protein
MPIEANNLRKLEFVVPQTNEWNPAPSILPERFRSTSEPVGFSIVQDELGSVSEAEPLQDRKPKHQS